MVRLVNLSFTEEMYDQISKAGQRAGIVKLSGQTNISAVIRLAVAEYVVNHKGD